MSTWSTTWEQYGAEVAAHAASHFNTEFKGNGFSKNINCPFHEDRSPSAAITQGGGITCFVCGFHSAHEVAECVGFVPWDEYKSGNRLYTPDPTYTPKKPKHAKQKPPTFYSDNLIEAYTSHPDRFKLWHEYRRLSEATVTRYHLGVGPLPGKSDGRLIVPIKKGGRWIGVRGRALNGGKPKWQTARGTTLQFYCPGGYRTDGTLWIVENMADALLLKQQFPEYDAGAPTGGARSWSRRWTDALAKRPPALVMLAFDNDEAGRAATAARYAELCRAGLNVEVFPWDDAPEGADIGAYLMGEYD